MGESECNIKLPHILLSEREREKMNNMTFGGYKKKYKMRLRNKAKVTCATCSLVRSRVPVNINSLIRGYETCAPGSEECNGELIRTRVAKEHQAGLYDMDLQMEKKHSHKPTPNLLKLFISEV